MFDFDWDSLTGLTSAAETVLVGRRGHLPMVSDPYSLLLGKLEDFGALVRQLEVAQDGESSMVIAFDREHALEEEEAMDVDEEVLQKWQTLPNLTVIVLIDCSEGEPKLYAWPKA